MKLLLQAGIHLIKKVITFVIYGRSVQVFKACTLFYFFPAEFFFSQIFLRGKVLSHRFHRYTQIFFIMIFLHRISRMNRKAFLLAGLLTDFRRGDLFGRCRYPLRLDKAIHQRFHKKSVYICEICGTKNNPPKKNLCISVKSVGQNLPTKKNLRHLRNLRDQKQ